MNYQIATNMDKHQMIKLLLDAKKRLHKQEEGKEVTSLDITLAHDYVDMVVDALIDMKP